MDRQHREIEQGLASHKTHYRSYRWQFLQVIWPNQQCQSTRQHRYNRWYTNHGLFKI